jgi:hypothetical protein
MLSLLVATLSFALPGFSSTNVLSVGNKRFRDLIGASVKSYHDAKSRVDKAGVVNDIVKEIQASGGRFLRRDEIAGTWHGEFLMMTSSLRHHPSLLEVSHFKPLFCRFWLLALGYSACREKVGHAIRDAASCIEARQQRQIKQEKARKAVATAIMGKSSLLQTSVGSKGDSSFSKLTLGSDLVKKATGGFNETDRMKSSIDSIMKHFADTNAFPAEEHDVDLDSALRMEPPMGMEGVESTMLAKGNEDWVTADYVKLQGRASAALDTMGTIRGEGAADQDEQDFLAFIDLALGPLPADSSTVFSF